jgi:hypothetical protein
MNEIQSDGGTGGSADGAAGGAGAASGDPRGEMDYKTFLDFVLAMEVWRCGGVEVWRCGGVEVWRCGGVEVWRFRLLGTDSVAR